MLLTRPRTTLHTLALSSALFVTVGVSPLAAHAVESDQGLIADPYVSAADAPGASSALSADAGLAASSAVTGLSPSAFQSALIRSVTAASNSPYLGAKLSGVVIDASSGQRIWAKNGARTRIPASTQKVMTAYTVLRSMSTATTLNTTVRQSASVGYVLYLKGAGDPSLSTTRLKSLAARTAVALRAQNRASAKVYIDESVFPAPTNAAGWKSSYLSGDVQPVRGLTMVGYRGPAGAAYAAKLFVTYLVANKITATYAGAATAPSSSRRLALTASASVGALVQVMLNNSVNDYAEYLFRQAALARGAYPSWANAIAHQKSVLKANGVPIAGYRVYDGSGLSRSNRMPALSVATVVRKLWLNAKDKSIAFAYGAMPRAGQTGTLNSRFSSSAQACARGKVLAKTGTLNGVVGLAGIARGSDGRDRAFALLENGSSQTSSVRSAIDTTATAIVGCRLG